MSEIALPIAGGPGLLLPGPLLSDERLARLASRGSASALAVLYERHHQALYRYCRAIVRNHEDAQDALQSTMTRAFSALRASERDLAVRPWRQPNPDQERRRHLQRWRDGQRHSHQPPRGRR
jgi:hypothetical protein